MRQHVGYVRWIGNGLLILPAAVIIGIALPQFVSDWTTDQAFPVPAYVAINYQLPHETYERAAALLATTDRRDGNARIVLAEVAASAGYSPTQVIPILRAGVESLPASARGWTLLAQEYLVSGDRKLAARALSLALILGPYDYWVAGRRARLAATLWNELSPDDQKASLAQAALLWEIKSLRGEIPGLIQTPGGVALLTRALTPEDVRALNRWMVNRHLLNSND